MATVTGYTAARMKEIEDSAIIDGEVIGDNLILTRYNTAQINAGSVRGPQGVQGPQGSVEEAQLNTTPYARKNGLWVPTTEEAPINGDTFARKDGGWIKEAGGVLGVPGVASVSQDNIINEVDLTNLSTQVTVAPNRRIKISYRVALFRTVLDGYTSLRIKEGTIEHLQVFVTNSLAPVADTRSGFILLTPTAGGHTYKLTLKRETGTGTVALYAGGTFPATIVVEDVGSV